MQDLEEKRLKLLEKQEQGKSLIIPIILSGEKYFPKALSEKRFCYKFTDIEFSNPRHKVRVKYSKEIKKIAEYIFDRCYSLEKVANQLSHDCDNYCLPSPDDAIQYIESLGEKVKDTAVPFVIRSESAISGGEK